MGTPSQGAQSRLYVEPGSSPHTFDSSSETYEFLSENLILQEEHIDNDGIRGTRSHQSERVRGGLKRVQGTIRINPSPADLDLWFPRILGAAESTDSFALAETLPAFGVIVDRVAETFEYEDCYVNRATFRSSEGGLLELELDIIGADEVVGTNAPSVAISTASNNVPYTHTDLVLTLAASARDVKNLEITIDNQLEQSFNNSRTATGITPRNRIVSVRCTNPFTSDETALYAQAVAGAAGTAVYTNGGMSTTFTFGRLQVPARSPSVTGKNEIPLVLDMVARMVTTTRELVVTHDSTA